MPSRNCFLVLGAEGSGTYMLAEALVDAGCKYIPEEDFEELCVALGKCKEHDIVMRRSLPHRGEWPMLYTLIDKITDTPGYRHLTILAMIREPNAAALSVVKRNNTHYHRALKDQQQALRKIFELETRLMVIPIPYASLVSSRGFREWLFIDRLNLQYPDKYRFRNEDGKYYE